MPLGKGSYSWLIIWRFIDGYKHAEGGREETMPVITHHLPLVALDQHQGRERAADGAGGVPYTDAVLCMQLFSTGRSG